MTRLICLISSAREIWSERFDLTILESWSNLSNLSTIKLVGVVFNACIWGPLLFGISCVDWWEKLRPMHVVCLRLKCMSRVSRALIHWLVMCWPAKHGDIYKKQKCNANPPRPPKPLLLRWVKGNGGRVIWIVNRAARDEVRWMWWGWFNYVLIRYQVRTCAERHSRDPCALFYTVRSFLYFDSVWALV